MPHLCACEMPRIIYTPPNVPASQNLSGVERGFRAGEARDPNQSLYNAQSYVALPVTIPNRMGERELGVPTVQHRPIIPSTPIREWWGAPGTTGEHHDIMGGASVADGRSLPNTAPLVNTWRAAPTPWDGAHYVNVVEGDG